MRSMKLIQVHRDCLAICLPTYVGQTDNCTIVEQLCDLDVSFAKKQFFT